jgi:hypothetical protein
MFYVQSSDQAQPHNATRFIQVESTAWPAFYQNLMPWRQKLLPVLAGFTIIIVLVYYLALSNLHVSPVQSILWLTSTEDAAPVESIPQPENDAHPILELMRDADSEFEKLFKEQTYDVACAAWVYRQKR